MSGQEEAEAEEGRDEGASGDHRWIGGEPALLYLAREGLEACALAALAALAPPRASHPGGATPTSGATASDAAVSTDNLQGSATSPPSDQCLSGHQPAAWHDPCAAGIDAEDADGFTALHFAANMGLRRLSAALLACGAAVDRSTRDVSSLHEPGGRTPLHLAAASGQSAIVSLLLAADAPHSAEDWQGATPFQMACRRGHHAVAAQISSWATRCGGGASEVPTEQELRGFELVEGMAVRERARRRRCIDGRPLLQTPFTLDGLLSDDGCRSLIAAAEGVAARRGWLSSRHRYHSTVDMPLHVVPRAQYAALRSLLDGTVLPTMRRRYATAPLRIREAFVVKYEAAAAPPPADGAPADAQGTHATAAAAPRQAGLGIHRDGTLLNCVLLLSDPADFDGGGTVFAPPLDRCYRAGRGDCLCSCGQLPHGAAAVTRGIRYVLIAFIDELVFDDAAVDDAVVGEAASPPPPPPYLPPSLPLSSPPSSSASPAADALVGQLRALVCQHEAAPMSLEALHARVSELAAEAAVGQTALMAMATSGGLAGLAPLGAADDASTSGADCGINGAALAESGRGDDGGGERETSAGWMDAAERAARGFSADETVVMPLPNFDDSDDDD
uniref:Fe2OG dioxygenase domain-containing protein n=1 Tax=Emiliania huxleyi TaxID=2903 RepID=A0A7S3WWT1_EMIHU